MKSRHRHELKVDQRGGQHVASCTCTFFSATRNRREDIDSLFEKHVQRAERAARRKR